MSSTTFEHKHDAWLVGHAEQWVEAGLISPQQATSIKHFEHLDEPPPQSRLTIVAEVASYLGSVIAFAGGAAIVGPNWERIGVGGQLLIAAAIAALGFVVGTWLVRLGEIGTERLGSFLWLVGTGGLAMAAAVVMHEIDPRDGGWYAVVIGAPLLAVGFGLWRNLDRPLQLLTTAAGLAAVAGGAGELTDLSPWVRAPVVWVAAAGFGMVAAAGRVRPRLVALVVAAAGMMIGSMLFSMESERLSALVAVATAALIVSYALHDRSWPLVAVGLFAFFVATTSLMQTVLHGMLARLVAVVFGLIVVAVVAMRAQRSNST